MARPSAFFGLHEQKHVDARDKPGHDERGCAGPVSRPLAGRQRRETRLAARLSPLPTPSWPAEATKLCFAPMSRPSTSFSCIRDGKDVDARDKPGHDEDGVAGGLSTS